MRIQPFILAGGSGSRLWPASRAGRPKPLLSLLRGGTLLQHTWDRVSPLGLEPPVIVTSEEIGASIRAELPGIPVDCIWIEPEARNTGPAVTWALHEAAAGSPDTVAAFFPADHVYEDEPALRQAVNLAAAVRDDIVLLGIVPDRAETGYGYIEAAEGAIDSPVPVKRFLEKPSAREVTALMGRADILWNSGVFIMPVQRGLEIVREAAPSLAAFLDALPPAGSSHRPGQPGRDHLARAFAGVPRVSFDVAVLEQSSSLKVLGLEAGWSDVGNWDALWAAGSHDEHGNMVTASSVALESEGCLIHGHDATIAALGVKDLVIVAWEGAVLVCPRERAQDVRRIVAALGARRDL